MPSTLASMTRRRSRDDLAVAVVKRGYAPSRTTSNIRTWCCGQPGTELMTVICGVISWKRRRSCRGMLHDDDDDDIWRYALTIVVIYVLWCNRVLKVRNTESKCDSDLSVMITETDRSCNNNLVTTELVVQCRKSQVTYGVTGMKKLQKREVRSRNKVR